MVAAADLEEDIWRCSRCGWTYPNSHPSARHRRKHKQQCGKIKGFELQLEAPHHSVPAGSSDDSSSGDDEGRSSQKQIHQPDLQQQQHSKSPETTSAAVTTSAAILLDTSNGVDAAGMTGEAVKPEQQDLQREAELVKQDELQALDRSQEGPQEVALNEVEDGASTADRVTAEADERPGTSPESNTPTGVVSKADDTPESDAEAAAVVLEKSAEKPTPVDNQPEAETTTGRVEDGREEGLIAPTVVLEDLAEKPPVTPVDNQPETTTSRVEDGREKGLIAATVVLEESAAKPPVTPVDSLPDSSALRSCDQPETTTSRLEDGRDEGLTAAAVQEGTPMVQETLPVSLHGDHIPSAFNENQPELWEQLLEAEVVGARKSTAVAMDAAAAVATQHPQAQLEEEIRLPQDSDILPSLSGAHTADEANGTNPFLLEKGGAAPATTSGQEANATEPWNAFPEDTVPNPFVGGEGFRASHVDADDIKPHVALQALFEKDVKPEGAQDASPLVKPEQQDAGKKPTRSIWNLFCCLAPAVK